MALYVVFRFSLILQIVINSKYAIMYESGTKNNNSVIVFILERIETEISVKPNWGGITKNFSRRFVTSTDIFWSVMDIGFLNW